MAKNTTAKTRTVPLNARMRDSLVSSILRDLPKPNFDKQAAALEKDMIAALPDKVKACFKDPSTKHYVRVTGHSAVLTTPAPAGERIGVSYNLFTLELPSTYPHANQLRMHASSFNTDVADLVSNPPSWVAGPIKELALEAGAAMLAYHKARNYVRLAVSACRTVTHLRERHPHFNSYVDAMLAEFAPRSVSNLPDDSLAAALTKLGWPDGVEPSATKAQPAT